MVWRVKGGRTLGTGVRIATGALRPRNDRVFTGSTGKCPAGGQGRSPLRKRNKRCNGRATARVAPTKALQGVRRGEKNPPVTASPCQPPLGKGAMGTGVRIATASVRTGLAMTLVFHGGAVCGGAHGPRPTRVFAILRADRGVCPYAKQGDANKHGRAG